MSVLSLHLFTSPLKKLLKADLKEIMERNHGYSVSTTVSAAPSKPGEAANPRALPTLDTPPPSGQPGDKPMSDRLRDRYLQAMKLRRLSTKNGVLTWMLVVFAMIALVFTAATGITIFYAWDMVVSAVCLAMMTGQLNDDFFDKFCVCAVACVKHCWGFDMSLKDIEESFERTTKTSSTDKSDSVVTSTN
jgi:hypothetical protein